MGAVTTGIGHNLGPAPTPGENWQRHCWSRARADLLPHLPLEVLHNVTGARRGGLQAF